MSGIAVIWNRDGRLAEPTILARMTRLMAHRGPDRERHWVQGPIAIGHRALNTTAQPSADSGLLVDEAAKLCLTFDGRIDNREELVALLENNGSDPHDAPDAQLVLAAYRKWGEECPAHLLGDFAFAIWDERRRRLFCARDPLAVRPLFYASLGSTFICGSEIRALFALPGLISEPDLAVAAARLMRKSIEFDDTLYKGIFRIPIAHSLTVTCESAQLRRYWDIDPDKQIRYRNDGEYAEHFRELFFDAVRRRMRSTRPIAAMLSGGLDSSGIVCVAESIRQKEKITHPGFETFSMVFDHFSSCDERRFVSEVVNRSETKANYHVADRNLDVAAIANHERYPGLLYSPQAMVLTAMFAGMRDAGFRVVLDGTGGDELAGAGLHHRVELMRRGKWLSVSALVREYASMFNLSPSRLFVARYLKPAAPEPLKALYRWSKATVQRTPIPGIVPEETLQRTGAKERIEHPVAIPRFQHEMKSDLYRGIFSGWAPTVLTENYELIASFHGIEMRQPYRDRRLVEFSLALPPNQLWRNGWSRFVFRNAMKGLVPEPILQRRGKGVFVQQFDSVLAGSQAHEVEALSENSVLVRLGVADGRVMRNMVQKYQTELDVGLSLPVSDLIALELMCREILGECEHTAKLNDAR
jgi:asparagine synthase (glutamine-hydrolysing)